MNNAQKVLLLHNVETERDVIGACLYFDNLWDVVSPTLKEEYFTDADAKKAYGILRQMESEGKKIEMTDFAMRYTSVGGNISLFITEKNSSYEVTKQQVELLRKLTIKRKMYVMCAKGMNLATDPMADEADFTALLSEMGETSSVEESGVQTFADVVKELRKDISDRRNGVDVQGHMTGLHIFDCRFGLHDGDLVIIAGRTSQGKSTLATTLARNMGMLNIPSAYYSLEMGAKQLTARIMARDVMISSSRMLYDKISDGDMANFDDGALRISNLPIYFDDKSKMSFSSLRTSIRKLVRKYGVKVVYIDYLQILVNGLGDNREQALGDICRELKRDAVELDICIVALSQLARVKEKQNPEPTLGEMRGSGQIEEACDVAVLVYRPSIYGIERYKDGTLTYGTAQLTIAKGRNIGLAQEIVKFDGDYTFFGDLPDGELKTEMPVPQPKITSSTWQSMEDLPF